MVNCDRVNDERIYFRSIVDNFHKHTSGLDLMYSFDFEISRKNSKDVSFYSLFAIPV